MCGGGGGAVRCGTHFIILLDFMFLFALLADTLLSSSCSIPFGVVAFVAFIFSLLSTLQCARRAIYVFTVSTLYS